MKGELKFLGYAEVPAGASSTVPVWSKEEATIRADEGLRIATFIIKNEEDRAAVAAQAERMMFLARSGEGH